MVCLNWSKEFFVAVVVEVDKLDWDASVIIFAVASVSTDIGVAFIIVVDAPVVAADFVPLVVTATDVAGC